MSTTDNDLKAASHVGVDEELASDNGSEQGSNTEKSIVEEVCLKLPELTVIYWCEKMTATTFGETFADYFTQTLGLGYQNVAIVLIILFVICLFLQIKVKTYHPVLFWSVMGTSALVGTTISDFIDRTLGWGYPLGMGVLLGILLFIIGCWKLSGEHMNVAGAMSRKAEAFYWTTILVSNTLGTALGDFLSDSATLGFAASAGITGGLLAFCALLAYFSKVPGVLLFWIAFVLTRPFGATFGDLLTKSKAKGGLDLGTLNASMVLLALFLISFAVEIFQLHKARKLKEEEKTKLNNEEPETKSEMRHKESSVTAHMTSFGESEHSA
jgi:uncharacterized membrane-anchored protein